TGQEPPFTADIEKAVAELMDKSGLGHSQLNELLLALGYDRVSKAFFDYLTESSSKGGEKPVAFKSLASLRVAVDTFRRWAILRWGNIKYAFKYLSKLGANALAAELEYLEENDPKDYKARHDPLVEIDQIPGAETYYLGYLVLRRIKDQLAKDPNDAAAKAE